MSVYYKNECADCDLWCYDFCPLTKVEHHCCNCCGRTDEEVNIFQIDEDRDLCEDCNNRINFINNQLLEEEIYNFYINNWLKERGLTRNNLDKEGLVKDGKYKGTTYDCKSKFLDNEYQEDEIINFLCQENGYKDFHEIVKEYGLEDYIY